jgi:CBS-domain-containing membrane protein
MVRDVMHKNIKTIRPDSLVTDAARQMRDGDFGVMPVVDGDKIVGMVTDRDIAVRAVAESKNLDSAKVNDIMTPDVLTCSEEDDLDKVEKLMSDRQVRRIVVMGKNDKLVGIVSVADLARQEKGADKVSSTVKNISEPEHREPSRTQH